MCWWSRRIKGSKLSAISSPRPARGIGSMNYVTIGAGSAAHLNSERFLHAASFEAQPIPYQGIAGRADGSHGRAGRLLFLSAVACACAYSRRQADRAGGEQLRSARRTCPTCRPPSEAGFPNSEYNFWFGVFAPAKTPPDIIQRLYEEIAKALQDPGVTEKAGETRACSRCP